MEGAAGSAPTIGANVGGGWVTKAIIVQIQVRQTGRREAVESTECETSHSPLMPRRKGGKAVWEGAKGEGRGQEGMGAAGDKVADSKQFASL